jgi:hypothetical protein
MKSHPQNQSGFYRNYLSWQYRTVIIVASLIFVSFNSQTARAQVSELASYAAPNANSVIFFNVNSVMKSKLAASQNWKENFDKAYASGLLAVPPATAEAMISSDIDVSTWSPVVTTAAFDLNEPFGLSAVARQYNAVPDAIGDTSALLLSQGVYVVQASDKRAAVISSGNRQVAARWLNTAANKSSAHLSPYLQAAAARTKISDIVLAIDLQNAFPAAVIAGKLKNSEFSAKSSDADRENMVKLLQTLKGVTLEVIIKDEADGRLVVDFGADISNSMIATSGKEILIDVLSTAGLMIDDLNSWNGRADASRFILQGKLSGNGIRSVMRLINTPIGSFVTSEKSLSSGTSDSQMAYTTQQYFRSIQQVMAQIDEITKRDDMAISRYAKWFSRWADEIDALPILNVDPQMLDYSQKLSTSFRQCSEAIAGIRIQAGSRGAQVWNGVGEYYMWTNEQSNVRNAMRKDEQARGVTNARTIFRDIQNGLQEVRRAMVEKYKLEF